MGFTKKLFPVVGKPNIKAQLTGEKRCPKKGEWFLSGAIPEAYQATNNLETEYYIVRLIPSTH